MPIEIKELHIRIALTSSAPANAGAAGGKPGGDDRDAIVAECVEQVLSIIQNKTER